MALINHTSWKSEVTDQVDLATGVITLRAYQEGSVECTAGETPERVRTSNHIPKKLSTFPDNAAMRCTLVTCEAAGPILVRWRADYEWTTTQITDEGLQTGGIPQRWQGSSANVKSQQAIDRDYNGFAIMTVTGESPNPPLTDEVSDIAYTFTAEGRPWNPTMIDLYRNAIASDNFLGKAAGRSKIDDITTQIALYTDKPPEMSISVRVVIGIPPPGTRLFENDPSTGGWRPAQSGAAWYTWWKRWRAEGYKFIPSGADAPIDAHGPGEVPIPRLHNPQTGILITTASQACWYVQQTKPMLPFSLFFNSL